MSSIEVKSRLTAGAGIIYPGPYLNQLRGEAIEQCCQHLLAGGVRRLVINFRETELVNSIGISILLGVIEAVNEAGGTLILSDLNESNRELFEMLGLLSHVGFAETEERALARMREYAVPSAL